MKKIIYLAFLLLNTSLLSAQSKFAATWQGKMNVGAASLRVVLHITDDGKGQISGTMDSPDQGVKGIPCSEITLLGDSMIVNVADGKAFYRSKWMNDTTLSGVFLQHGRTFQLELNKADKVAELTRPQTPKPPFPYESEDVVYNNTDNSIQYGATITTPKGKGPFPAILLITGSGQQNRDEEIMGHKPFAVIADYLTRQGYIVMRVDDRGVGKSTGDVKNATTADFAKDINVSLNYLKKLKTVNTQKLGLCGHSEGGMIAEMVAAQRKDIYFIVIMAGPGIKNTELLTEQNVEFFKKSGIAPEAADEYGKLFLKMAQAATTANNEADYKTEINKDITEWRSQAPKNVVFATTHITSDSLQQIFVNQITESIFSPWFRYFLAYDPAPTVEKISCKVLALDGDKDIQVISKSNLAGLRTALAKSKTKNYEIKEVPGVNHLFQTCHSCTIQEYGELEETISPDVLKIMSDWLNKNVK